MVLQNKQIVLTTFQGYLEYLAETQPTLSPDVAYQVAANLTQAEFNLQISENSKRS